MALKGRTSQFLSEGGKVSKRRKLAVALRSGEGPLTIRFADFRHCAGASQWFGELTIYALAKPPERELHGGNNSEQVPIRWRYRL
jgi:hypothetical protein